MMKKLALAAAVLTVLLVAPVAQAENLWDPPWDLTYPTATFQIWEFYMPDNPALPTEIQNPYGPASIEITGGEWGEWEGLQGGFDTWHIFDFPVGCITIQVHNNPEPGIVKEVFLQVTSSKAPGNICAAPPESSITSPNPQIWHEGTNFYTYNYLISIPGNPPVEWITLTFPECTVIDEVVVHTRCVAIPEPGLLALSGLGTLLFFRKKK
ncbi:MAG: hypothetical protein JW889_04055 [Verrucomicrobia bacterium]|nr:hypothetical protein [Verrucomicrobiota bacterium]